MENTTINNINNINQSIFNKCEEIQPCPRLDTNDLDTNNTELPLDMQFNSGHVVQIVGYSTLFLISSIANCTVLMILIRRYKKTKSRVNLLLIHLAIADLIGQFPI